ncbi:MAG: phytanoyl-CoA dioxygenase family protein [Epsilonproteobacteria bacterium]|nr:phytanoyl-CoA dioxygenase family protein [Campylobacterota bacterium]
MQLGKSDLDFFDENGFLVLREFVDERECNAILDIAKIHIKYMIEPIETEEEYHIQPKEERVNRVDYNSRVEGTIRRLRQVYDRDIIFKNWMESRKIRPILEQILRDRAVITTAHHNSIMTKMPMNSRETRWHQDIRYWSFSDKNLISIWLALGEESSSNGVLEVIPKSHKLNLNSIQFDDKEYFREDLEENIPLIDRKITLKLSKGDVLIFHSNLLHRADRNRTDSAKISFVYSVKGSKTETVKNSRSSSYPEIFLD